MTAKSDMYPTGRVRDAIDYLKATRAHVLTGHGVLYGDLVEYVPNEVLDVIDGVLDRLGVPVVETEEEVRPWGTNNVPSTAHVDVPSSEHMFSRGSSADEVVLHLDGMSFVTNGNEVEWVGADCIDNLHVNVTTHISRVWPIDDPHHRGHPLDETTMFTVSEVRWDAVYNDGAYVDPDRVVTVDAVSFAHGITDDHMSRAEYEVRVNHDPEYTDIDTVLTRDEFTTDTDKEDEDNGN